MQVRVFRNLTRKCLSVQARAPTGWRTVAHASRVALSDVSLRVSEIGRQRVLRTGKKTVHAWAEGTLRAWSGDVRHTGAAALTAEEYGKLVPCPSAAGCPVLPFALTYNPRRMATFQTVATGEPVVSAERVLLSITDGVSALFPRGPVAPPPC